MIPKHTPPAGPPRGTSRGPSRDTFRGSDTGLLLERIRERLGDEAVILRATHHDDGTVEIEAGHPGVSVTAGPPAAASRPRPVPARAFPRPGPLASAFLRQGLHPDLVLRADPDGRACGDLPADRAAAAAVAELVRFDARLPLGRRVAALVGPTGAGKTTTIAKIAARMKAAFDMRIALVSADSYRVGAGHHLGTYASLLGLPFRTAEADAHPLDALDRAVASLGDADLILVDTAGYSPRDTGRVGALAEALGRAGDVEKLLVLPAPGNDVDLRAAAAAYAPCGCSRVILTKTDETAFIGPAVNTVAALGRPLAFLTTGQRVPEDIEPASARRLGWMLGRIVH